MSKLLDVINNTASRVVLECTRPYSGEYFSERLGAMYGYKRGERHPRNTIILIVGHWKIAAAKYQPGYKRPTYVKNKKTCSNVTKSKSIVDAGSNQRSDEKQRKATTLFN